MSRIKRPAAFKLGIFDWEIKYIDIESDLHGDTDKDSKIIRIFTKGFNEQVIKDTLLHECLHVVFEDITESVFRMDAKAEDVEEQMVRLLTPRVHSLFTDNEELREYIFGSSLTSKKK